jgi:RNA polymerase sigma-70 factor, ECF subfamily
LQPDTSLTVPRSESNLSVTEMALLGQLWEEYRPRLLAMLVRRIDPTLAVRVGPEEVLSETFIDAGRGWRGFQAQSALSAYAWLFCLARDRLIETWRRETRACRDLRRDLPWPEQSSVALGFSLIARHTGPSEAVVRSELRERMNQALAVLKDSYREVLWMRHYEQLSFAEIGQVLGVTENTATVRYVRALKRLRECWATMHGEASDP